MACHLGADKRGNLTSLFPFPPKTKYNCTVIVLVFFGLSNWRGKLDLEAYYKKMQSEGIIMSYKGAATTGLISSMVDIIQTRLSDLEPKMALKKKVFSILVEILQNIYHHFEEGLTESIKEDDAIIFILARNEGGYYINSGNYMNRSEVAALRNRLEEINALSPEELKEKYKQVLGNGNISVKGGAGLGIIDIARKSGNKLDYKFSDYNDTLTFFSLTVRIAA
jgi:Mor family transcriptional regulator